jgi:hypothetical protein
MFNSMKHPVRSSRQLVPLACVITALVCQTASAQAPWRWKFTAGETLQYDFQQQTQMDEKGAGKPTSANIKMTMRLTWKVDKVDNQGNAMLTQTIDRLSATMQVEKLDPISYDSASSSPLTGSAKEIGESVKPMLGAPFTVQMNARGQVTSVEPSAAIREAFEKTKASQLLSADGVLRQASFVVPEQAVAAGATWEVVQETPLSLGPIEQTTRYTYVGPAERNGKTIEKVDSDTQLKLQSSKNASSNAVIKESEQRGSIWFDAMAGRLVASELKQRLVTERPYREMVIRVQSVTTSTSTLVE